MRTPNSLMFLLHFVLFSVVTAQNPNKQMPIGVILDFDILVGKMARTSIAMALEDFYATYWNYSTRLVLHTRDSKKDNVKATLAALDLLQNNKTEVIIGPLQSSQAVIVSEFGNTSQVPVISFSVTSPTLTSINLPYFIRTTINDAAQVKPITSLIKAHGWRQVVPIYEDTDFGRDILPFLVDALEEINVRIPYRSLISRSSTDDQIKQELYKLQTMQTRVFVVHMPPSLASNLFLKAKEVGMMREGYVWIMTDGVTNMLSSLNESVTSAMKGVLGVRLYVPKTGELNNFITRWKVRFREDNPQGMSNEPSIYALWAYDTIYALAMAVEKVGVENTKFDNSTAPPLLHVFPNGPLLLEAITNIKFRGLSGNFELINRQLKYSSFEIINIVGRGMREVGYWREEQGLSREVDESNNKSYYSTSPGDLKPVIWPGETIVVPKGWEIPVSGTKLRVGVTMSSYPEFIKVETDPETNATSASGYSVDVFEAAVKRLPYAVPFEYVNFGGTSGKRYLTNNDLVYQVYLGNYDIVIGDITITYNRTRYADFSMPYTDSGIGMIVRFEKAENKNIFIFVQPLTICLWLVSFGFAIFIGITIYIMEPAKWVPPPESPIVHARSISRHVGAVARFISRRVGPIVQLSLFAYQEELESVLSKIVAIVSIFVLLILTSSYTASLSSMLTVQQLQPTVTDIYDLIKNGDYVGYSRGSFVEGLLPELGFDRAKIKGYYPDEFAKALEQGSGNGGVAAIVHEIPHIKFFLAKNCKSYTMVAPIYKTAGLGFAFSKGSPLVADISQAILNITGGDDINHIEKRWIGDQNCKNNGGISIQSNRLDLVRFGGLFAIAVGFVLIMLISRIILLYKNRQSNPQPPQGQLANRTTMIGVLIYFEGEIRYGPQLIYFEGEIRYGQHGAEYSDGPRFMFRAKAELGYGGLAETIYNRLGLDENQYHLTIMARINLAMPGHQDFRLVPIIDNDSWNHMYNMTINAETQYRVLELYVEANTTSSGSPKAQGPPSQPFSIASPSRARTNPHEAGPSQPQPTQGPPIQPFSIAYHSQARTNQHEAGPSRAPTNPHEMGPSWTRTKSF